MKYTIPTNATEVEILDPVFTVNTPPPVNQPPSADAGSDFAITLPTNTVRLLGRGSDPEGSAVSFLWTKVSGPAASIVSPNSANTDVAGLVEGNYVFRLTVTDDKGGAKTDDVAGMVKPAPIVVPVPGKYEGFGVAASSAADQSNIILIDSKAKFDASLGSNRILRFTKALIMVGRYTLNNMFNLMIDAAGFDVTIDCNKEGNGMSIEGSGNHHIILQGIRVINAPVDGFNVVNGAHDIIIKNCSAYSNGDGNIDCADSVRVSILDCILGNGKPGWGGDMLNTAVNTSVARCLFNPATSGAEGERCPLIHHAYGADANPHTDFRNNVVMNFGRSGGTGSGFGTGVAFTAKANVVNNFYHDKESAASAICSDDGYGNGATGQVFSAGNYITNGITTLSATMANNHAEFPIPDINKITMDTAQEAAKKVKAIVGTAVKNSYEQGLINAIPV